MKRITYLLLAVVSTFFMLIGSARAAETFDTLKHGKTTPASDTVMDGPALPCAGGDEENPNFN